MQHGEKQREPGDPGLTPRGQRQARSCAAWLAAQGVAAVYASPLRRAVETATPIADAAGVRLQVSADLRERLNWEPDCGLSVKTFLQEWQRATSDRSYQPPLGDSSAAAGARFAGLLATVAAQHRGQTVAVVSHGGVTTDLLRTLLGDAEVALVPGLIENGVPGGAITEMVYREDGWRAVKVASLDHISPDDCTGHRRE